MVGMDTFHFWRATSLVGLNTAGYELLGHVCLLALCAGLCGPGSRRQGSAGSASPAHRPSDAPGQQGLLLMLAQVACLSRLGVVLGSMCSALLLRRHLMLWAVFAPKVLVATYLQPTAAHARVRSCFEFLTILPHDCYGYNRSFSRRLFGA
jgi:hypothetical protein